jgi:hypothetical protein
LPEVCRGKHTPVQRWLHALMGAEGSVSSKAWKKQRKVFQTLEEVESKMRGVMKTSVKLLYCWLVASVGLLWLATPLVAQTATGVEAGSTEVRVQQLAAERSALQAMLDDANTPPEKRTLIQQLLEWNTRGVTLSEFKQRQALVAPPAAPAVAAATPPPVSNLAEAEAAPLPANVNVGGGAILQSFSKGRDAEASARSSSSLGLVKAQQGMDNATRESEAKLREAQNIRNQAGATALAQRQQDAASVASQQAASGIGAVMGESLVQSVQQGAQAAGQAIGGGAAGRMSGAIGQSSAGGGAVAGGGGGEVAGGAAAAGASTAAGQIFGGSTPSAPAAVGGGQSGAGEPAANPAPATIGFEASAMGDGSAKRMVGKRYEGPEPWQGQGARGRPQPASEGGQRPYAADALRQTVSHGAGVAARDSGGADRRVAQPQSGRGMITCFKCKQQFRCNICANPNPNVLAKHAHVCPRCERQAAPVVGLFDAACPKHGKYGGEIGKVKGCPKCEQERYMMWDAVCPLHGAYGGQGPVTGCPKCAKLLPRPGSGYIR